MVTVKISTQFLCEAFLVVVAVFDCLPHSPLIAKVHAHGFAKTSTEYLTDYLSHRKLKIKIYKTFSNWTNSTTWRLHIRFNNFYCLFYDLFLFKPDIDLESYPDDITPELEVINETKSVVESLTTVWFRNNCMKVNPDKFHLLLSDKKVITWIFVMRSFQVRAIKTFSGLKLIISLLSKNK